MLEISAIQTALQEIGYLSPVHEIDGVWDHITETAYRLAAEDENQPPWLTVQPQNEEQLPPLLRARICGDAPAPAAIDPKTAAQAIEAQRAIDQQVLNKQQAAVAASSAPITPQDLVLDGGDLDTDTRANAPDSTPTDAAPTVVEPAKPLRQEQIMRGT